MGIRWSVLDGFVLDLMVGLSFVWLGMMGGIMFVMEYGNYYVFMIGLYGGVGLTSCHRGRGRGPGVGSEGRAALWRAPGLFPVACN